MVLLYKRMCALCGALPHPDPELVYPDLRKSEVLFEICRLLKVPGKRKCPACPNCRIEIEKTAEFMAKCCKTQDFLYACFHQKLNEDKEILQFRKEFFSSSSTSKAYDVKREVQDIKIITDYLGEEPQTSPAQFVEVITESYQKEEDYIDPDRLPLAPKEDEDSPEEVLETDADHNQQSDADYDNDPVEDEEAMPESVRVIPRKRGRPRLTELSYAEEDDDEKGASKRKRGRPRREETKPRTFKHNFKCNHCDLILHSQHHLKLHEKNHGPQSERPATHVCDQCGKAFKAASLLREHYTKHSDERPFPCDQCDMSFKNTYGLKCHQETHSEQKHICPTCGLALHTSHTYHAHLKIHLDKRSYKCIVCPKSFKRHQPLKEHMFSHTDIRPYQCPFCGKTFVNGSSARLHKLRVHPKELAELEASGRNEEIREQHRNIPSMEEIKEILCVKFGLDKTTYQPLVPAQQLS